MTEPSRLRRAAVALLPPLLVFAVVRGWLLYLEYEAGQRLTTAGTFIRFDSHLYLEIVQKGYSLFPCTQRQNFRPDQWCGNAGWYPGYPMLVRFITWMGVSDAVAAVAVPAVFHFATLLLVWNRFLHARPTLRNVLVLTIVNVSAGAIYQDAAFPIAGAIFLILFSIDRVAAGWTVTGAVSGFAASLFYPTAWVVSVPLFFWSFLHYRESTILRDGWRVVLPSLAVVAGQIGALAIIRADTGSWQGYYLIQDKYGHTPTNPFATLWTILQRDQWRAPNGVPAIQTALAVLLVLLATLCLFLARRRDNGVPWMLWMAGVGAWLFPMSLGATLTFTRAESLILPVTILLVELPTPVLLVVLGASAWVYRVVSLGFFRGTVM